MEADITCKPAASVAKVTLQPGQTLTAEVGSMVAMTPQVQVETSSHKKGGGGGFMAGLKRMMSGENFFLNHFTAQAPNQTLYIAPGLMGDVIKHTIRSGALVVQGSCWLASDATVDVDATFQGLGKALFAGAGVFWVRCSGQGDVLLSSFGAIYVVEVEDGYVVDTGHIVAFEDTLSFNITKAADTWLGSLLGGEGLVCRFSGRGRLYCQSHNPNSFGKLLGPELKPR
jgi:uncharacterized protein (TIGR00266 family)